MDVSSNTDAPAIDDAGVGIRLVAAGTLQEFGVDRVAFTGWVSGLDGLDGPELPFRSDDRPAATLVALVADAVDAKVVVGDVRLGLMLHSDDDFDGSGIYVLVGNATAVRDFLSVTTGWQEMWWNDDAGIDDEARVLDYLESVCAEANRILRALELR